MRKFVKFLVLVDVVIVILVWKKWRRISSARVLSAEVSESEMTTPSPSETPTPTPTPLPTATITPSPTIIPTPLPTSVPQPTFTSQEINGFIDRFAGQYGVDPNVLRHIAVCESGFRADAVNGVYLGLFQFDKVTWKNNRLSMGEDTNVDLRANAEEAVQTAAYIASLGKFYVWPNCMP